jgi:hypothetical protein
MDELEELAKLFQAYRTHLLVEISKNLDPRLVMAAFASSSGKPA